MKRFKLWGGLAALFFSGVLMGVLGTYHFAEMRVLDSLVRERPRAPKLIMKKLERELGLSEVQRVRIEAIVCSAHRELRAHRERLRPDRERILQASMDAMKAELNPEQQKKLDDLHERLEARRHREERGRRGSGGERDPCE